jgi:hypothetical protein
MNPEGATLLWTIKMSVDHRLSAGHPQWTKNSHILEIPNPEGMTGL